VTAFRNRDGSVAVVVLNTATSAQNASFALRGAGPTGPVAIPFVTDDTDAVAAQVPLAVAHGSFGMNLPARSLVTFFLPAQS